MDIIDIMLAKAMTPQGQIDTYVSKANRAAAKAEKAEQDAAAAIATVEAAADTIAAAQEDAADLLAAAQDALETAQAAQINMLSTEDVDAEVKKLQFSTNTTNNSTAKTTQLIATYPDNTLHTENIVKMYKSTGSNEDGTMTQKAISDALASIPTNGGGSGTEIHLDQDDAGHFVVIGPNGELIASAATEEAIVDALIRSGLYEVENAVGLEIDYANRSYQRLHGASGKSMGSDFSAYAMYGGRTRCNVGDDGFINAFYGDENYREDGSNGQVMVYQPKFYYKRIISQAEDMANGKVIKREQLILSATEQAGFKLAPIFGDGLEYVLLPAFDAGLVNSKLTSIAGVKPLNNVSISAAEDYANARGSGWHIMNMAAESANQMLEMVEFGTMNGQNAIEQGITYTPSNSGSGCYFITGSTSELGNATGHASSTQAEIGGNITSFDTEGLRAISYRGMENPWGNLWSMIGGTNIVGNGSSGGGIPHICTNFNYTPDNAGSNYESVGFNLPSTGGWINAMGYGNEKYDWVYLPAETSQNASSLLPVGDGLWTTSNLNNTNVIATGGSYGFREECGPFYYAADRRANETARYNYGAKLLFIPTKNNIYTANIAKWNTYMGGR